MTSPLSHHLQKQIQGAQDFFWHRLRWRLIDQYLPSTGDLRLLDVGAGAGILGEFLRDARPKARYHFIEPLEEMRSHLRTRFGSSGDLHGRDHYDVDVVTILDVMEHVRDDRAFLADIVSRVGPGTRILVTVPAMPSLWSGWDVALGHYRRYSRQRLEGPTVDMPLRILETSYVFPELVLPAYWRRFTWSHSDGEEIDEADFPELPSWMNALLYRIGCQSLRFRSRWPAGTSLFMAIERVPDRD